MRQGEVVVLEACETDAPGVVDIFAVHEIAFVEAAYFVVGLAAHHEEGAGHDLNLVHLVFGQVSHVVGRDALGVGEEIDEARDLVERSFRRGKSAFALLEVVAVAVDHFHREAACVGVNAHEVDALHEGVVLHHCVRIEQQTVVAVGCLGEGLIVGFGETDILFVHDEVHFGELVAHHLHAPVY